MSWFFSKIRKGKFVEDGLNLLDAAIGFGLISGAAVVMAIGNFVLAGILGVLALGVFVRLGRRKRAQSGAADKSRNG